MYNRQERRKMEKDLGLFREMKNASPAKKAEYAKRKQEAGHQIHLKNVEDSTNLMMESANERIAKQIQGLIDGGMSEADANAFIERNIAVENARAEKLEARRLRQLLK